MRLTKAEIWITIKSTGYRNNNRRYVYMYFLIVLSELIFAPIQAIESILPSGGHPIHEAIGQLLDSIIALLN